MKKVKWGITATVAAVALAVGVAAGGVVENINAELHRGLQVIIDGEVQTFYDANGQTVYPIMYNGTTYLPLRAIGGVMGKPVAWDGETETVILGEKDAWHSVVAMPEKGDGAYGAKIIDVNHLTFPYGELQEPRTYANGIRLESVNSADKEFSVKLDDAYAVMSVTLHNPQSSESAAKMEIRDKKTDIVLLSQTLEPGQFFEAQDVNLNNTDELIFRAEGAAGNDDEVFFLEPQVK